jgi:hypothetical protein
MDMISGRRVLAVGALVACCAAAPADAHTLNLAAATQLVRATAGSLGPVDWVVCRRDYVTARRRSRHRASCLAAVDTTTAGRCFVTYRVRLAGQPGDALAAEQTGTAWCSPRMTGL